MRKQVESGRGSKQPGWEKMLMVQGLGGDWGGMSGWAGTGAKDSQRNGIGMRKGYLLGDLAEQRRKEQLCRDNSVFVTVSGRIAEG